VIIVSSAVEVIRVKLFFDDTDPMRSSPAPLARPPSAWLMLVSASRRPTG
jgi:hypothetical protein